MSEEVFNELHQNVVKKIMRSFQSGWAIMDASHYKAEVWYDSILKKTVPKLSFRLTSLKNYCRNNKEMEGLVISRIFPSMKDILQGVIPLYFSKEDNAKTNDCLTVDLSVYSLKRKMRCCNAYKFEEQKERVFKLINGSIEDTIINNIPENCNVPL